MKERLSEKKFCMSMVIGLAGLCATVFFPTQDGVQSLIAGCVFMILLPLLFSRYFLHQTNEYFSVGIGRVGVGVFSALFGIMFSVILFGVLVHFEMLSQYFTVPASVKLSFLSFLIYITILGVYIGIIEFFFRGFLQRLFEQRLGGALAVLAQSLCMMIAMAVSSHVMVNVVILMSGVVSVLSGCIVLFSRSILYSFIFSYISAILGIVSIIMFVK